jgi:parvulin-like peptidyl-prolyl isomerase
VYVLGGVCLTAVLWSMAGCTDSNSKKAALTEQEITRLTLAQKPERPDQIIVNGETITWDDLLAALPEDNATAPPVEDWLRKAAQEMSLRRFLEEQRPLMQQRLNRRIEGVVLSKQAERELGDVKVEEKLEEYAEKELRRFIFEEHGGNGAAADEALQKAGMNRLTFKQWRKKQSLAEYLVESRYARKRPITYRELLAQYDQMKEKRFVREGVLQLRLIDIEVAKVPLQDPNGDPTQEARRLAADLRRRIEAGEDFAALARQYSHGTWAEQGGLWRPRNPDSLAAPYDVLAQKAQGMQQGQVAGPLEAPGRFFIIKVEEKQERGYQPLDEVQEEVRKEILYKRRLQVLEELDAEVEQQIAVADTGRFVDYCLEQFYRQVREQPATP